MEGEQELIRKAKAHDSSAFAHLMEQYGGSMYKVAKAILKDDEDVADAMQETALSCWEKIGTLQKEQYFKTWLIRILINHCNAIYRKRSRYVLDNILPETAVAEDAYANVEWMELLQRLGEKYRIVIVLYYIEGFPVRDIAGMLKISESTVKWRMSAARKKMERYYRQESEYGKAAHASGRKENGLLFTGKSANSNENGTLLPAGTGKGCGDI